MKKNDRFFNVININSEYSIVIDYGSRKGAEEGTKVRIFVEGEDVKGLDGESLGNIEIFKEDLEITVAYDNYSICKKITRENMNPFLPAITKPVVEKQTHKLNIDDAQIKMIEYTSDEPIRVGDLVKILK